jgi:hypothetical protein
VIVTVGVGDQITCTFTNERRGAIAMRIFDDRNGNGVRNSTEAWLVDWNVQLYRAPSQLLGTQNTDSNGSARFANLTPGSYVVCEVVPAGWTPTTPSANDPVYGQPCRQLMVTAGMVVSTRFGNTTEPISAANVTPDGEAIYTAPLPDTDDDGNEIAPAIDPWAMEESNEEATAQPYRHFLPLLAR